MKFAISIRIVCGNIVSDFFNVTQQLVTSPLWSARSTFHFPTLEPTYIKTSKVQQCDSAIGLHLLQNNDCVNNSKEQKFSILWREKFCSISQHCNRSYL